MYAGSRREYLSAKAREVFFRPPPRERGGGLSKEAVNNLWMCKQLPAGRRVAVVVSPSFPPRNSHQVEVAKLRQNSHVVNMYQTVKTVLPNVRNLLRGFSQMCEYLASQLIEISPPPRENISFLIVLEPGNKFGVVPISPSSQLPN